MRKSGIRFKIQVTFQYLVTVAAFFFVIGVMVGLFIAGVR